MSTLSRAVLNSLLPEGAFWTPAAQSDYDLLLEGIADNTEEVYQVLKSLACIRCPETTTLLDDLEKEYGITPATLATEAERRSRLKAFIYRRAGTGAFDLLQSKLREAGFDDVYVHPNDPAVDPNIFLAQAFNMVCGDLLPGGNAAQCGEPEAICAQLGGELLVNGDLFKSVPRYVNQCYLRRIDESTFITPCCGDGVVCGDFDGYESQLVDITYQIPTESGYWPLIFFVGGPAERRWRFLNEAVMNLPLKTDAIDISKNNVPTTATDVTWTGGVANFNGVSSKINSSYLITGSSFTISMRVKIKTGTSNFGALLSFDSPLDARIEYVTSSKVLNWYSVSNKLIASDQSVFSGIELDTEYNLLIIADGTYVRCYKDNILSSTFVQTSNLNNNILCFGFGYVYLKMEVSNFYIFNRALTDEERTALYTDNAQTGGDGELSEIEFYNLPIQRRLEFRRTILKFKPMHSWGGLIVIYG